MKHLEKVSKTVYYIYILSVVNLPGVISGTVGSAVKQQEADLGSIPGQCKMLL